MIKFQPELNRVTAYALLVIEELLLHFLFLVTGGAFFMSIENTLEVPVVVNLYAKSLDTIALQR